MIHITRIEAEEVERGIHRMLRKGKDLRPVFRDLKRPFKTEIRLMQRAKQGPDGGWESRGKSTKKRDRYKKQFSQNKKGKTTKVSKRRRRGPLLGKVANANSIKPGRQTFYVRNHVKWSGAHQDGATVGRGAVLPKRTFLWFTPGFLSVTERSVAQYLVDEGWAKR